MTKLITAVVAALAALLIASPAGAQDTSQVYVLHGIPGVDVDVYVNGDLTLETFSPEDIAGPLELPAGDYDIQIFAAGADPEADEPVIDVAGAAVPGGESVSLIAHLDGEGNPTLSPFVNNLGPIPAGSGRGIVRHTAAAPAVDIVASGAALPGLTNLENGDEAALEVPAGDYPTGIAAAGTTDVIFEAPLTIEEGIVTIVYAIGSLEDETFGLIAQTLEAEAGEDEGADEDAEQEEATDEEAAPTEINAGNSGLAADQDGGVSTGLVAVLVAAGAAAVAVPAVRFARR